MIPAIALKRKAVVYVRQSTQSQVMTNLESKRRQYDLVDVAPPRGFVDVEIIDDDLGRSASGTVAATRLRPLVAWLCAGKVGAVLCFDASRLARNGRDWHHLLELCGLVEARVIDLDGVYNPCRPNDRLLLGMKGSISEFELGVLRATRRQPGWDLANSGCVWIYRGPAILRVTCAALAAALYLRLRLANRACRPGVRGNPNYLARFKALTILNEASRAAGSAQFGVLIRRIRCTTEDHRRCRGACRRAPLDLRSAGFARLLQIWIALDPIMALVPNPPPTASFRTIWPRLHSCKQRPKTDAH